MHKIKEQQYPPKILQLATKLNANEISSTVHTGLGGGNEPWGTVEISDI